MDPLTLLAVLFFGIADADGSLTLPSEEIFSFDDEHLLPQGESYSSKLWRSPGLPTDGRPVPLLIFMHGILQGNVRYTWLTTHPVNAAWDARVFLSDMLSQGTISPLVVVVPSQTTALGDPEQLFTSIDFDALVDTVDVRLAPYQRVDRQRIMVLGHSAGASSTDAGAFRALLSTNIRPWAFFAVDAYMSRSSAHVLGSTAQAHHVIVTYMPEAWPDRPFGEFKEAWDSELNKRWPSGLRVLERHMIASVNAHVELVEATLRKWLPVVLPHEHTSPWTTDESELWPSLSLGPF